MVKFYSTSYSYDHPFSTVSLAYFLRYPNPYSRHVASTDTISRSFDPATQRLTTVRLHLKRSRVPASVAKLLPKGTTTTTGPDGRTQSFILEESVVDVREGWMHTESRNLDWNNVLSVIERHTYRRPASSVSLTPLVEEHAGRDIDLPQREDKERERTDVDVSVTLKSRIGEQIRKRRQRWGEQANATSVLGGERGHTSQRVQVDDVEDDRPPRQGWFSTWSTGAVRSAIEAISLQRTERSQPKAQKGMSVVLARLREGGLQAVLEGMEKDKAVTLG